MTTAITIDGIRAIADQFGTQWRVITGDRKVGKTTALVSLYVAAHEAHQKPTWIVPNINHAEHIIGIGRHRFNHEIYRNDVHTARQLDHLRGHKIAVFLIDEWDMFSADDHKRLVEAIHIHKPQFVFATVSANRNATIGDTTLLLIDVQPVPVLGDQDETVDYRLDPTMKPITDKEQPS